MIPRRQPTLLRGLVCMTDFLFAVIAGLLFLTIQISQDAQAARTKSIPSPETTVAVAGTEFRLNALESSTQQIESNLIVLTLYVGERSIEGGNIPAPTKVPTRTPMK